MALALGVMLKARFHVAVLGESTSTAQTMDETVAKYQLDWYVDPMMLVVIPASDGSALRCPRRTGVAHRV